MLHTRATGWERHPRRAPVATLNGWRYAAEWPFTVVKSPPAYSTPTAGSIASACTTAFTEGCHPATIAPERPKTAARCPRALRLARVNAPPKNTRCRYTAIASTLPFADAIHPAVSPPVDCQIDAMCSRVLPSTRVNAPPTSSRVPSARSARTSPLVVGCHAKSAPVVTFTAARWARATLRAPLGEITLVNDPPKYAVVPTTSMADTRPFVCHEPTCG